MSKHDITVECKCGEQWVECTGELDYNEIVTITHDCGAKIYVGSVIDYEAELVDVFAPPLKLAYALVDKSEVPEVFINIHGGDMTCRKHAGMSLDSAIATRPRAKKWATPFGEYVRATELDVASWRMSGIDSEFDCETCGSQKRRAA